MLLSYSTNCRHCGWRGTITRGDVRWGPWLRADGTSFYRELICPQCKEQVENPFSDSEVPTIPITPEEEEQHKDPRRFWETLGNLRPYPSSENK